VLEVFGGVDGDRPTLLLFSVPAAAAAWAAQEEGIPVDMAKAQKEAREL
jgi:hypothetical protein